MPDGFNGFQSKFAQDIQELFVDEINAARHIRARGTLIGSVANREIEGVQNIEQFLHQFGRSELDVLTAFTFRTLPVVFKFRLPTHQPILQTIPLLDQLLNLDCSLR
jgi:hypothetical protein